MYSHCEHSYFYNTVYTNGTVERMVNVTYNWISLEDDDSATFVPSSQQVSVMVELHTRNYVR